MVNAARAAGVLGAVAAWHIGPAATWLPGARAALWPGLDGRGDPSHVALTFDDGPDPVSTPHFLRALDALSVRATFFVLGARLAQHPALGRLIAAEGHELAVHGWRHDRPWCPHPLRDVRDLARTADLVAETAGRRPLWYRPAYGVLTGGRWAAARSAGLRTVLWSAWGRDWTAGATAPGVRAEVTRTLRGGGTVLLHDSDVVSAPGAWRAALGALPGLVGECRRRGLRVGTLEGHGLIE
ncbi:polysaccharide deacetylase family protein [Streptomyces sp. WAC05374]|nr:polysaccharide deacetylase family protein [Streptomyces sp. WAC05374]RST13622.1 polysaccharide deacetylase family protein [Streptomyces sp. WAC05374]TDF50490.1 polysaccharide deacetylase family protein [Streptomyces sp. WAC05374]TDF51858.1 polysaccharide deacetylase family protein [Streptomyces sp. WAC05374]TDF60744.1 polysaccharide deacetylase family protein [Streptomyces sp. WAC05374]